MIVIDANVLIGHFEATDEHHERAEGLLESAADEDFGASVLSVAEALILPARAGQLERARTAMSSLGLASIPLLLEDAVRLATLRASTALKLPDCCVLLAAEKTSSAVATLDARVAVAARQLGLTVHHD